MSFASGMRPSEQIALRVTDFDAESLKAFAARYPKAQHFLVAQDVDRAYTKHFDSLEVRFSSLNAFVERVEGEFGPDQF